MARLLVRQSSRPKRPRRMGEFLKQFGAAADSSAARSMKKFVAGRWEGEIVRLRFRLSGIRREVPMPNAKDLLERARRWTRNTILRCT